MKITFTKAIILISVVFIFYFVSFCDTPAIKTYDNKSTVTNTKVVDKTTLSTVKLWFEGQKETVALGFENYLDSQTLNSKKIYNTKVTDIEFKFDSDLGCYYLLYFNCEIGHSHYNGHARGFLEYKGNSVEWWSLEIAYNNYVLLDDYNYDYEEIVVNHYKELISKYK